MHQFLKPETEKSDLEEMTPGHIPPSHPLGKLFFPESTG